MTFYVEEECRLFPDNKDENEYENECKNEHEYEYENEYKYDSDHADLYDITGRSKIINADQGFDINEITGQVINAVLEEENCPYETQVNVLLTDNEGIRYYNKEYRGMDEPTDVLSFPSLSFAREADFSIAEEEKNSAFDPESGELLLGDVMISVERLRVQAADYGHSLKREFAFLVAHSIFHLCGYDHQVPEDALRMEKKQEKILHKLGISRV